MTPVAKLAKNRMLAVNERGLRIGETHPKAVLTDHEIGLLFELRDEGYSYSQLAVMFEVAKGTVAKILTGQRRAQEPSDYKRARG